MGSGDHPDASSLRRLAHALVLEVEIAKAGRIWRTKVRRPAGPTLFEGSVGETRAYLTGLQAGIEEASS